MDANEIIIGTKLEFEVITNSGSKISQTYYCHFMKAISNNEVTIASSVEEFEAKKLPLGTKIKVTFAHEIYGMQSFTGIIINKEKNETLRFFQVSIDDQFTKIQRRQYFRLDSYLEAEYRLIEDANSSNKKNSEALHYRKAQLKNISYNGALIVIDEYVHKNTIIDLIILLPNQTDIKMSCRIIKISEIEVSGKKRYELNLSLLKMNQDDKENLKKFITKSVTC
ncbi:MAG: flagellar brake protein [Acetobacterium sp.]